MLTTIVLMFTACTDISLLTLLSPALFAGLAGTILWVAVDEKLRR
jgi:hypothetical protein